MIMKLYAGSKYQSNLNEIDKSEQKSIVEKSNGFDWPSKPDIPSECKIFFLINKFHYFFDYF